MNAIKLVVFIVAAATIFAAACGPKATQPNTTAENSTKPVTVASPATSAKPVDELASGQELYVTNCQICHRDTGKGGKVTVEGKKLDPEDLTSSKMKKHDDAKLFEHISDGVTDEGMPAFKDKLSPEQIKQVVQYIRKLQGGTGTPATL
jgi:mono/diheme cytochrome c family protein